MMYMCCPKQESIDPLHLHHMVYLATELAEFQALRKPTVIEVVGTSYQDQRPP